VATKAYPGKPLPFLEQPASTAAPLNIVRREMRVPTPELYTREVKQLLVRGYFVSLLRSILSPDHHSTDCATADPPEVQTLPQQIFVYFQTIGENNRGGNLKIRYQKMLIDVQ
jgi:hypothetical protein